MVFTVSAFTYGIAFNCPYSGTTINRKPMNNYSSPKFFSRQTAEIQATEFLALKRIGAHHLFKVAVTPYSKLTPPSDFINKED